MARDALDVRQRHKAGRLGQLLHLQMTTAGLSAQPLSQLSERRDREMQLGSEPHFGKILAEIVGDDRWSALMPFRAGYPTSPTLLGSRRDLQAVLLQSYAQREAARLAHSIGRLHVLRIERQIGRRDRVTGQSDEV